MTVPAPPLAARTFSGKGQDHGLVRKTDHGPSRVGQDAARWNPSTGKHKDSS
jgi:hypothetical protein